MCVKTLIMMPSCVCLPIKKQRLMTSVWPTDISHLMFLLKITIRNVDNDFNVKVPELCVCVCTCMRAAEAVNGAVSE